MEEFFYKIKGSGRVILQFSRVKRLMLIFSTDPGDVSRISDGENSVVGEHLNGIFILFDCVCV